MREGLLRLTGAIVVGKAKAMMATGEIGIDRDCGLIFGNCHFDFTGQGVRPPQG